MCLILVGIDPRPGNRVLLLANRDEFHARASAPAGPWVEDSAVVGGRDLVAGGSWLAVRGDGRFAAVTNVRNGPPKPAPRSRGDLVRDYVLGNETTAQFLARLQPQIALFAPFNLLLGDGAGVVAFDGTTQQARPLGAGLHTLSNGPLTAPWPKMQRLEQLTADALADGAGPDALLALLRDRQPAPDEQLPQTGFDQARERMLSPIFTHANGYGTRASTVVEIADDGQIDLIEVGFDPDATPADEVHWCFRPRGKTWSRAA